MMEAEVGGWSLWLQSQSTKWVSGPPGLLHKATVSKTQGEKNYVFKTDEVAHNSSTEEAQAERALQIWGQPDLHNEF